MTFISDPWFYVLAVPAVVMFGISKGGFGGGLGVVAVPLMALAVSPVQAAAILLPILCLMDLFSLWAFRGKWIIREIRILVPASLLGIGIGTLLFSYMSPALIRLMLGAVAVTFTLHYWAQRYLSRGLEQTHFSPAIGVLAATVAGFTSFVAHAGGPPLNMYLLRRGLDRTMFAGTAVLFFTVVNYVKLLPYAWLGQFNADNLGTSLVLSPLAPVGIGIGFWLHQRVSDRVFFFFVYVMLFVVGIKLIADGAIGLGLTGSAP